jgi:putative transposase
MSNQLSPSDVTDREWEMIAPFIPAAKTGGRCRTTDMRQVLDGICYVDRGGIAWRSLPREYPPWPTVSGSFRAWRLDGPWERIHDARRSAGHKREERASQPTAAIIDSQSVTTTNQGGPERGDDAGKQVKGRQRPILVDPIGRLLVVVVHAAGVPDRDGAQLVLQSLRPRVRRLRLIGADGGDRGALLDGVRTLRPRNPLRLAIVKRRDALQGFVGLPRRWVVERTFAWLGWHRRLSKDYETLPATSEILVRVVMIRLMLVRLA